MLLLLCSRYKKELSTILRILLSKLFTAKTALAAFALFLFSSQGIAEFEYKKPLAKDFIQRKLDRLGLSTTGTSFESEASWYGDYFHGRTTANMEIFNKNTISAAHKTLPLNTYLLITNLENQRQLVVRVNDRGPYIPGREIDLSEEAARQLAAIDKGVIRIKYEILESLKS